MLLSLSAILVLNVTYFMLRVTQTGSYFPKPLNPEEEKDCLSRLINGDTDAKNMLIERNLRLVVHIVKKYYSSFEEQDDLISIGTIGLIKGVNSFNPDKSTKLSTYVSRCIENEILMHFRATKKTSNEISLSDPIDTDKDGNALSLIDIISCEDNKLAQIELSDNFKQMYKIISTALTKREQEIITLRYGLYGTKVLPQREIAKKYGISRSYVSRIEKKAIEKLSHAFKN